MFISKYKFFKLFTILLLVLGLTGCDKDSIGTNTGSLVAYYAFDGTTNDLSENRYDGTVYTDVNYTTGVLDRGADLNTLAMSVDNFKNMRDFTILFKLKIASLNNTYNNIIAFEAIDDEFKLLFFANDGHLRVERKDSDLDGLNISGDLELSLNKFYDIAFVNDVENGVQKVFIDGSLVNVIYPINNVYDTTVLKIGYENNFSSPQFDGVLDELQIYDYALSEIAITGK